MHSRIVSNKYEVGVEQWLRTTGVARYDAYHRAPKGISAAKVFALLRKHHARRAKQLAGKGE